MLEPVRSTFLTRLLARGLATLHPVGPRGLAFEPEVMKAAAVREVGLADFGDRSFEEGLEVACRSLREDAALSLEGRLALGAHVVNALSTRLLRVDLEKRDPERFRLPLERPLVILGLPRTGTTFLHRLLSLDERARSLKLYEVQRPVRGPGPDRRRFLATAEVAILKAVAPGLDAKHFVHADEPEECMFLLDSSLVSFTFWVLAPVHGYLDWYLRQDQREPYRVYRRHLQIFQHEEPGKRLTLKAPAHTGNLAALAEALPEALIVQTHRDPVEVVSSVNSLFYSFYAALSERFDLRRVAATNAQILARSVERAAAARGPLGDRVLDVRYRDLVADPVGTVRRVHDHFGLAFEPAFERRLEEYVARRPRHGRGVHSYSAEEHGLTDELVAARFRDYTSRYLRA